MGLGRGSRPSRLLAAGWLVLVAVGVLAGAALAQSPSPTGSPGLARPLAGLQDGDVFAAVGNGEVEWRAGDGTRKGTLSVGRSGQLTGMAFGPDGNLYVTNFDESLVHRLDLSGGSVPDFGSGYDAAPESIVFDADGNAYVGQAEGAADVLRFDRSGRLLRRYDVRIEERGSDWIDLAGDQCTLVYTSEGSSIFRHDVCEDRRLTPFATGLPGTSAYALRLLPDGGLLVADNERILRLDGSGDIVTRYDAAGIDDWFALNLDPDGTSFWSASLSAPDVFRFDIESGDVLARFAVETSSTDIGGLAVRGERTAARGGAWLDSVPTPGTLEKGLAHVLATAGVAALIVLLMPFPAELFNKTLEEHYDELAARFAPARNRLARLRAARAERPEPVWLAPAAIAVAALLYGFLNPSFGISLQSAALFGGLVLGLILAVVLFNLPFVLALGRAGVRSRLRAYPGGLLVALGCVLASRLIGFQPGYLYGAIIGYGQDREVSAAREGRAVAVTVAWKLAVSIAAWFARAPVHSAAVAGSPSFALVALDAALITVLVAGLEGATFGLLPLRFLDGDALFRWNRAAWTALFGLGVFAFAWLLLNPYSGYLTRAPAVTVFVLFAVFGLGSVLFWAYFRYRTPGEAAAAIAQPPPPPAAQAPPPPPPMAANPPPPPGQPPPPSPPPPGPG